MLIYAEARSCDAWDHTAPLLALVYNTNRGKGSQPMRVEDIHPHRKRKQKKLDRDSLRAMKPLFKRRTRK